MEKINNDPDLIFNAGRDIMEPSAIECTEFNSENDLNEIETFFREDFGRVLLEEI